MKLFAYPLQVGVFVGKQLAEHRCQQPIVFLQGFDDAGGWKIQLGQTAAVVFHLLDELEWRLTAGEYPCCGAGSDGSQSYADLGIELMRGELVALELGQEAAVQSFRMGQQEDRQPVQMDA